MFWDLYQHHQIQSLDRKVSRAKSDASRTFEKYKQLEDKVECLALACQTLWELLRDQTGLTDEELEAKMEAVDLRDGQLDGKLSKVASSCPKCGRKTSRKRPNCLYCGEQVGGAEVFDRI